MPCSEYDWTDQNNPNTPIPQFIPKLEDTFVNGDMLWSARSIGS